MSKHDQTFDGLRVAAFESRRGPELERLITRLGGTPSVSPSMREVPLGQNPEAIDFANKLITGQVDVVIVMTGVGLRHLLAAIERHVSKERFLASLSDIITIARGPKPVAALKELGVSPTHRVPEPNTWREVLTTIDQQIPIANCRVVLQEYGRTNPSLIAGLEARGATVWGLKIYNWELPEDVQPLIDNARGIAHGEIDVVLFTSAHQIRNLLRIAKEHHLEDALRMGLQKTVVASIGPTTSECLHELGLPVDFEPSHGKMGQLVTESAAVSHGILERKRRVAQLMNVRPSAGQDTKAAWYNSAFMKACRREPTEFTPIWLMRQAGRYMAEYREVRERTTFLDLCKNPQLCSEVMVTAVDKLGVDAAIIFSDLLPILEPMGLDLEYAKGEGPVIHNPVRESADVNRVIALENVDSLHFVMETVSQTRKDLSDELPVIGFAGAPFTLASYMIEGGASRNYLHTKTLMYRDPGAWKALMQRLAHSITIYLNAQIRSGAQAVQIFDSWVGCLGPDDYRTFVLPYVQQIISQLDPGTPVINFATGNPALLPLLAEGGAAVIGIDWRVRLDEAWKTVGYDKAVQGNLDPLSLLADRDTMQTRAEAVLKQAGGRPGHIFNLGHGVLPQTSVENACALVEIVHELSRR
jgi:uroporphyrinogen decarboxylase